MEQEKIHEKGFGFDFGKMKVSNKVFEDIALDLNALKETNKNYANKQVVLKALADQYLIFSIVHLVFIFVFVIILPKCIGMIGILCLKLPIQLQ